MSKHQVNPSDSLITGISGDTNDAGLHILARIIARRLAKNPDTAGQSSLSTPLPVNICGTSRLTSPKKKPADGTKFS